MLVQAHKCDAEGLSGAESDRRSGKEFSDHNNLNARCWRSGTVVQIAQMPGKRAGKVRQTSDVEAWGESAFRLLKHRQRNKAKSIEKSRKMSFATTGSLTALKGRI